MKTPMRLYVLLLALGVCVSSCSVDDESPGNQSGDCDTGDGIVNTYNAIGKWKKISSSFEEPKSEEELEFNFDILIIEPGTVMCMGEVQNKATVPTAVFTANYTHQIDEQILSVSYSTNARFSNLVNQTEDVSYSFGGECADTRMTLTYPNGVGVEVFELFSTEAEQGDCALPDDDS